MSRPRFKALAALCRRKKVASGDDREVVLDGISRSNAPARCCCAAGWLHRRSVMACCASSTNPAGGMRARCRPTRRASRSAHEVDMLCGDRCRAGPAPVAGVDAAVAATLRAAWRRAHWRWPPRCRRPCRSTCGPPRWPGSACCARCALRGERTTARSRSAASRHGARDHAHWRCPSSSTTPQRCCTLASDAQTTSPLFPRTHQRPAGTEDAAGARRVGWRPPRRLIAQGIRRLPGRGPNLR